MFQNMEFLAVQADIERVKNMTINEILHDSGATSFVIETHLARTRIQSGGKPSGGIGIDAIRPKLPHLDVHRDTTYRPDGTIDDGALDDELTEAVVDVTEDYPENETLIPLLEYSTRHGGRVIQGCENNTVETLSDGSVNLLPTETAQIELCMQLNIPLTIL